MNLRLRVEQVTVHALVLPFCAATLLFSTRAEATPLWTPLSAAYTLSLTSSYGLPNGSPPGTSPIVFSGSETGTQFNFDQTLQTSFALQSSVSGFCCFLLSGVSSASVQITDNQISVSTYTHEGLGGSPGPADVVGTGPMVEGSSTVGLTFLVSQPLDVSFTYDYFAPGIGPGPHTLTFGGGSSSQPLIAPPFFQLPSLGHYSLEGTLRLDPGIYGIGGGSQLRAGVGDQEVPGDSSTLILNAAPAIPEPSAAFVFGMGLVVIATRLRRGFLPCNSTQ
jgi:hypothetical protein